MSHRHTDPGRTLAKRRRMLGATQHDIARATGLSINRVVFIETGRVVPEPEELDRIRHALRKRARKIVHEMREL